MQIQNVREKEKIYRYIYRKQIRMASLNDKQPINGIRVYQSHVFFAKYIDMIKWRKENE